MPPSVIPVDMRLRLAQSMPIVERSRARIKRNITEQMHPPAQSARDPNAPVLAAMLFELLIDGGSDIAAFGELRDLSRVKREHCQLGVSGQDYSRFGQALGPALRAVLGPALPPKSATAWCDAFQFIAKLVSSDESPALRDSPARGRPNSPEAAAW